MSEPKVDTIIPRPICFNWRKKLVKRKCLQERDEEIIGLSFSYVIERRKKEKMYRQYLMTGEDI